MTNHTAGTRVTICSSDGTGAPASCVRGGAPNARIVITGNVSCVSFATSSGGYTIQDLDCYNTASGSSSAAVGIAGAQNVHDVTFDGFLSDGFFRGAFLSTGQDTTVATNILLGVCGGAGHWFEIRDGSNPVPDNVGDRSATYGTLQNSHISAYVHNFSSPPSHNATSHYLDLSTNGSFTHDQTERNVTIECGMYVADGAQANAISYWNKIDRGHGWIIQDNYCQALNSLNAWCFDLGSHNDGNEGISGSGVSGAGAQILRNQFVNTNGVWNEVAADVDVYNNVLNAGPGTNMFSFYRNVYGAGQSSDVPISNVRVFNNTIYYAASSPSNGGVLVSDNPGTPTRPTPTNLWLYNNLVYNTRSDATIFGANCARFGTNGANIQNNYVFTPNDSSPGVWSSCSAAKGNNTSYNVDPGLSAAASGGFSVSASSMVVGKGLSSGAPLQDFMRNTRPSPPSIGAYDVGSPGSGNALQPPVLIQVTGQ
jgi:hypothetical protein